MQINNKELGQRIKYLRQINGLTQTEFGERFNAHKSLVSTWERGTCKPNAKRLIEISDKFNVSRKWFLYGVGDENE